MPEPKNPICDACGARPAEMFLTHRVGVHDQEISLCSQCAREVSNGYAREVSDESSDLSMEQWLNMVSGAPHSGAGDFVEDDLDSLVPDIDEDPFVDDDFDSIPADFVDEEEDAFARDWNGETLANVARCASCGTTWDTIRSDGRVGCAACYVTFAARLASVMERVQRGSEHVGKTPRAAHKRRLRLEQLRQRRDNQLTMLQNRLKSAVASEHFEEAALLRDKIKVVSATIWNESI